MELEIEKFLKLFGMDGIERFLKSFGVDGYAKSEVD